MPKPTPVERLAAGAAFLLPILATLALYLPSGLLMPARLALLLLVALAGWSLLTTRRVAAPRTSIAVLVVVISFAVFGVIGWFRYPGGSLGEALSVALACLATLAFALLTDRRFLKFLLAGWVVSAVLAALVAVWEVLTAQHLPRSIATTAFQGVEGFNEITSFFDNPNLYAYHCAIVLLLLPMLTLSRRSRWWVLGLALLVLALLLRTHGQLALIAVALGALWWGLSFHRTRIALAVATVVLAITAVLRVPPGGLVVSAVEVALDGLQWDEKSTGIRAALARTAWWIARGTSFLGAGPGGFERWARQADSPSYPTGFTNPHFGMLEVLANYGIVPLVALTVVLLLGVIWAVRARLRWGPEAVRFAYGAGALALTVPLLSMTHSTWLAQPLMWAHLCTVVAVFAYGEQQLRKAPAGSGWLSRERKRACRNLVGFAGDFG